MPDVGSWTAKQLRSPGMWCGGELEEAHGTSERASHPQCTLPTGGGVFESSTSYLLF